MTRATTVLLCISLGLFAVSHVSSTNAAEAINLVRNPGFETADGGQPAFWGQRTPSDIDRTLSWDSAECRSGRRCLKIENRAATLSRWRTGQLHDFSLAPGGKCRLTGWIKTKDVVGDAHLQLYFIAPDGHIAAQPRSDTVVGTHDWTKVGISCDVPKETGYVMVYLGLQGTGSARFDDLVLEGTPAEPKVELTLPGWACYAEDFDCKEGFVPTSWRRRLTVLKLAAKSCRGRAEVVFWGESARYNATVVCGGPRDACTSWSLLINDKPVARWTPKEMVDSTKTKNSLYEMLVEGLDIQSRSRIAVVGESKTGDCCRIARISFVPTGAFRGEFLGEDELRVPPTPRVYEQINQRRGARGMLAGFVGQFAARVTEQREQELAALKTPDQWRARQQRIRDRLVEFLGDFGPKCPLKPNIVGKLDRPDYVIEKLIFESQPGYYCTANFYVPKRREFPRPGVIFTCGHAAEGKAYHLYHEACLGLVLKGYVVLVLDPTGQGERSEYFDPATGAALVSLTVSQHHYLARPSWLVGRSLAGYRTWDCIRAVDYLVGRPEVDPGQIAAVGNSGGGQMALLITAADPRVKVCAAAHPGGSMENTYLAGQGIIDKEILALIPPRPCAFVVGATSGEEPGHRRRLEDMLRFYDGLGAKRERGQMLIVEGVHNMEQPKREASYAWLNKWLGYEAEGTEEPPLKPETVEDLHCTKTGFTLRDLKSESGQTLNAKAADRLRPARELPSDKESLREVREALRKSVTTRIGLHLPENRNRPTCLERGTFEADQFVAEKLLIESEQGIQLPSLLLRPRKADGAGPIVLLAGELGKPTSATRPSLALELVRKGHTVMAVDVRGTGETDPRIRAALGPLTGYQPQQFGFESQAVNAAYGKTTMLAMRTFDVIRAMDYLTGRADLAGHPIVLVGEGLGGLWMLTAAAMDSQPAAVVCVKTVPSYKLIVGSQYYNTRDYFWVNGALKDFDIPDLIGLAAPLPVMLIDPADAMLEPLGRERCLNICQWPRGVYDLLDAGDRMRVVETASGTPEEAARQIELQLQSLAGKRL